MLMKTGILYFTTCFHGFGILRHVDPFVKMLHIYLRSKETFCYLLGNVKYKTCKIHHHTYTYNIEREFIKNYNSDAQYLYNTF